MLHPKIIQETNSQHLDFNVPNDPYVHKPINTGLATSHNMQSLSQTLHGSPLLAEHHITQSTEYIPHEVLKSFQDSTCTIYPPLFTAYIRDFYRRSIVGDCKNTKWPPTSSEVFIQLAIIDRKKLSSGEADAYTKAMVMDGNVDAILQKKRPIELSQIGKGIPENRIVVVEGAPGVGKSTFAWEFCKRWERGEIAQQYQLVLLLRMRDEKMSRAESVSDLIYHPIKEVCQSMQHEVDIYHGSSILLILEGFDELPDTCRHSSSIFMKLINGDILSKATVIITSRPWATGIVHETNRNRIFQHIEILGFTETEIKRYVTSALSNPDNDLDENAEDDFDDIIKYIDTHPQIKACMYIPLNAAIVVGVYEESKAGRFSLPKTLTQFYHALTQTILVRYLHGHREYNQQRCNITDFKKDLPHELFAKLLDICLLAYKGIFNTEDNIQLIFSDLQPDFETLDLMQSVSQMCITRGKMMSHNFLHLTFQEFLAALHISFMSAEKQLEHFQRHKDGRFRVVLKFLAGLTNLTEITLEQCRGLLEEIPDQEGDEQQRDCYKRMIPDISVSAHHANWLFEAQNTDLLQSLLFNHTVIFEFTSEMQPLEYYSAGYCIVQSHCNWSLKFTEDPEEGKVQMLLEGAKAAESNEHSIALRTEQPISSKNVYTLLTGLESFFCLEELYWKVADNNNMCMSWSSLQTLRVLTLTSCSQDTVDLSNICLLHSLESLTITAERSGNIIGLKSCKAIAKLLSSSTSLKELHFNAANGRKWSMTSYCMDAITKGMSDNTDLPLQSLQIEYECTLSNTAATLLALFIRKSTMLNYIRMCSVAFSGCGLLQLLDALLHCSSLQEKSLKNLLLHSIASDNEVTKLNQVFHDYPDIV